VVCVAVEKDIRTRKLGHPDMSTRTSDMRTTQEDIRTGYKSVAVWLDESTRAIAPDSRPVTAVAENRNRCARPSVGESRVGGPFGPANAQNFGPDVTFAVF